MNNYQADRKQTARAWRGGNRAFQLRGRTAGRRTLGIGTAASHRSLWVERLEQRELLSANSSAGFSDLGALSERQPEIALVSSDASVEGPQRSHSEAVQFATSAFPRFTAFARSSLDHFGPRPFTLTVDVTTTDEATSVDPTESHAIAADHARPGLPTAGGYSPRWKSIVVQIGSTCCDDGVHAEHGDIDWAAELADPFGDREGTLSAPLPESETVDVIAVEDTQDDMLPAPSDMGGEAMHSGEMNVPDMSYSDAMSVIDMMAKGAMGGDGAMTDSFPTDAMVDASGGMSMGGLETGGFTFDLIGFTPDLTGDVSTPDPVSESAFDQGGFVELDLSSTLRDAGVSGARLIDPTATSPAPLEFAPSISAFDSGPNPILESLGLDESNPLFQDPAGMKQGDTAPEISNSQEDFAGGDRVNSSSVDASEPSSLGAARTVFEHPSRGDSSADVLADPYGMTVASDDVDQLFARQLDALLAKADELESRAEPRTESNRVGGFTSDMQLAQAFFAEGGMVEFAEPSLEAREESARPVRYASRPVTLDATLGMLRSVSLSEPEGQTTTILAAAEREQHPATPALEETTGNATSSRWHTLEAIDETDGDSEDSPAEWTRWGVLAAVPAILWGQRRRRMKDEG